MVCCRNPKGTMFGRRVEGRTRDERVQFRQHNLKLLEHAFPLGRWFILTLMSKEDPSCLSFECASIAANRRFSSSKDRRRLRPGPGAGLRILNTGLVGSPIPYSLIATVNRWPSKARSSRTVLFARGMGSPFASLRSSSARRRSRNLATISGDKAASEYLPRCLLRIADRRYSGSWEDGRFVGVTSSTYRFRASASVKRSAVAH
jgi:hypothetical protein